MSGSILVTYATRYGSTREAAERIATRLAAAGHPTAAMPVSEAGSLDGVGAVVLGTPLYIGAMLPEAVRWLERHRAALERLPVAVFALGPTRAADETADSRDQLEASLAKRPWLRPVAVEVFVGRYDPSRFRLADRLLTALPASPLHGLPAHDERDGSTVDRWADSLADRLAAPA